jgi:putative ATP-dependent endonuclease of the OLD family
MYLRIVSAEGQTMRIKRLAIENVRSFLDRREICFDGQICILIGPNGGGKTNLLDTLVIMLRRYIFNSPYYRHAPTAEDPDRWAEQHNEQLNQLVFEKNSAGSGLDQVIELELEITQVDLDNMKLIQGEASKVLAAQRKRFHANPWARVDEWDVAAIKPGARVLAVWRNGSMLEPGEVWAKHFLHYLHVFETDNYFRAEAGMSPLRLPMVYLPVNRASSGFNSAIGLSGYNDYDQKRTADAVTSRSSSNIIQLAIGRLARRYRLLQENSNVNVRDIFYQDENLSELAKDLHDLNYSWELVTIDPLTNSYDVRLTKQGSSFLVSAASSGERELLTYLFAIYALNVRDALIVVDEPELHLHPRWQTALFALFEKLAKTTGNQFILATHSPTFISPSSIQYVSRVFSENQKSDIVRLNSTALPNSKHLFNVVNSQNNERIFFTDNVILVEGLSDRIVFERILDIVAKENGIHGIPSLEVVSVGGKGLFTAYEKLLEACHVKSLVVADLDYIEQIGAGDVKTLFALNADEIKEDVIANVKSLDGAALAERIEDALTSGDWKDAQDLWAYIKSRRIRLRTNLEPADQSILDDFIASKESENIFILSRGALEDYLPKGYRSKDMGALISLVNSDSFWDSLPLKPRAELELIAKKILGINV